MDKLTKQNLNEGRFVTGRPPRHCVKVGRRQPQLSMHASPHRLHPRGAIVQHRGGSSKSMTGAHHAVASVEGKQRCRGKRRATSGTRCSATCQHQDGPALGLWQMAAHMPRRGPCKPCRGTQGTVVGCCQAECPGPAGPGYEPCGGAGVGTVLNEPCWIRGSGIRPKRMSSVKPGHAAVGLVSGT